MIVDLREIDGSLGLSKLPDFLVLGAPRCGTTSLYYYLGEHPEVYMAPLKEPWFFIFYGSDLTELYKNPENVKGLVLRDYIFDLKDYIKLFKEAPGKGVLGEVSVAYLYAYDKVIGNIRRIYGSRSSELKFIVMLRDPAERAWSHYKLLKQAGKEDLSFEEVISERVVSYRSRERWFLRYDDYIGFSKYYEQVRAYIEAFGNVEVIFLEELAERPEITLKRVLGFLGVNSEILPGNLGIRYNVLGSPKAKILKPLYDLAVRQSKFKDRLRWALPPKITSLLHRFKYWLQRVLSKEDHLPRDLRKRLINLYFKEDILKLKELLKDWLGEERLRYLDRWLIVD